MRTNQNLWETVWFFMDASQVENDSQRNHGQDNRSNGRLASMYTGLYLMNTFVPILEHHS